MGQGLSTDPGREEGNHMNPDIDVDTTMFMAKVASASERLGGLLREQRAVELGIVDALSEFEETLTALSGWARRQ